MNLDFHSLTFVPCSECHPQCTYDNMIYEYRGYEFKGVLYLDVSTPEDREVMKEWMKLNQVQIRAYLIEHPPGW